ncbi:hypothetical protein ACH5RR_032317, partial [Cinchona calisaya]
MRIRLVNHLQVTTATNITDLQPPSTTHNQKPPSHPRLAPTPRTPIPIKPQPYQPPYPASPLPVTMQLPNFKHKEFKVLISYDLLSYVDGSIPSPPQSIFDSTGRLVVNPSYVAWQFVEQSVANVLILNLQIQTLKKGTNSMENYLRTLKQIVNSLAAIGSPISSQDLMLYGLSGLPLEYELFVIAITAHNGLKSFADLRNKLLQQEHRIHSTIQLSHDSTTAFVTVSNTKFRGKGRGHGGR